MLVLTAAVVLLVIAAVVDSRTAPPTIHAGDAPRQLPNPGARDVHALAGGTLSRAPVPSWT